MGRQRAHGGSGGNGTREVADFAASRPVLPPGFPTLDELIEGLEWWLSVLDDADALIAHAPARLIRHAEATADLKAEVEMMTWDVTRKSSLTRSHFRTTLCAAKLVMEQWATHSLACPLLAAHPPLVALPGERPEVRRGGRLPD